MDEAFRDHIREQGNVLFRPMPWRQDIRPYYVLVSELMLQQTQVSRVMPKFTAFINRFPDEASLASANLADVVIAWQGLGYNRRAKFLHEAAKRIVTTFDGQFPTRQEDLLSLPGVGKNTLGAIQAYAYNQPSLFIETNIRTVYLHHYFNGGTDITDHQILQVLERTLDQEHPREFYWALMDYGAHLKATGVRNIRSSRQYKKQSALNGSVRQVRGQIIRALAGISMTELALKEAVSADDRFGAAAEGLMKDGLIAKTGSIFHLTK